MKKITWITLLLLFASFSLLSQTLWYPQNSGTNSILFDVCFVDTYKGWCCGNTGIILRTEDGGATWIEQEAPANNTYYGIFFTDQDMGWSCGFGGKIIHTEDGGSTWVSQESGSTTYLYDLFFMNADTGWVIGGDNGTFPSSISHREVLFTTNGGQDWTTQHYLNNASLLRSVHFSSFNNGYAVGESGTILKTTDGGTTWDEVMYDQSYHFNDVFVMNNSIVFVVGDFLGLPHTSVLFKTTNGGTDWTSQSFGEDESLSSIWFADGNNGWAVGGGSSNEGIILRTMDGGINWTYEDPDTDDFLLSVFFIDSETGWSVGQSGTIVSTLFPIGYESKTLKRNIDVFPVPVVSEINIDLSELDNTSYEICLYSSSGQIMYEGHTVAGTNLISKIDVIGLNNGIYLLILKSGTEIYSTKIIIAH